MMILGCQNRLYSAAIGALVFAIVLLPSLSARAATSTATFGVSATVQATCNISAASLAFGTYTGAVVTATSNITVTCTKGTSYNVGLDAGLTPGATVTTRQMKGATTSNTDLLSYALYSDSAMSSNWGNTVNTDTVAGTGNGSPQTLTVYGKIPGGQFITPDSYSDTITATITY